MSGYFLIYRGLHDHPLFQSREPFSRFEAWVDLIEQTNFAESLFRHKSQVFLIPRGSVGTSYRSLADNWRWSVNRVIREMNLWKSQSMVDVKTEHGYLHVIIRNYEIYQNPQNKDGTLTEQKKNTDGTATNTNQKKGKKGKKETILPPTPLPDWLPSNAWDEFKRARVGLKAPMTEEAERLAVRELERLRSQGYDPKAVLEQSIMRGWKGLFKLKGDENGNNRASNGTGGRNGVQVGSAEVAGADHQPPSKWQTAAARVLDKIERGEI